MGKAIIIPDVDFSSVGLGNVTPLQDIPLVNISLSKGATNGNEIKINAIYYPSNTTYKGLSWSIVSGGEYATINNAGTLTVLQGANGNDVVVKAVSTYDNSIEATLTVNVTYNPITIYDGLVFDGASAVDLGIAVDGSHTIEISATFNPPFRAGEARTFALLGGRDTISSSRRDIQYTNKRGTSYTTNVEGWVFGTGSNSTNFDVNVAVGTTVTIISSPSRLSVNGISQNCNIPSFTLDSVTYYIGTHHQTSGVQSGYEIYDTIHYVKIYDSNSNLIAHFVPCTYNGVSGLYNKVANVFKGNVLGGTLTVE